MVPEFRKWLDDQMEEIRAAGLLKEERLITSAQGAEVMTADGPAVNLCANNYLGLANHSEILKAAEESLAHHGFGMASVRFICGTQDIHRELEERISRFFGTEDTILYASCFDANGGLFETILGPEDCVISDALNHASIIDGIRLCKAQRKVYRHCDLEDLEVKLKEASSARFRLIATDGAFSMHGSIAPLREICRLAERYAAQVMIDDCHGTGVIGPGGKGTPAYWDVVEQVDVMTSTLGKALGGATGGFTTGRLEIIALLRQRSRPYLFSNSVAPPVVAGSLKALDLLEENPSLVERLSENTRYFRKAMRKAGFQIPEGEHPIVPIILGEERKTAEMADWLNKRGIFVVGFSYPVVPKGEARIRVQITAGHSREQLDRAVSEFTEAARRCGYL